MKHSTFHPPWLQNYNHVSQPCHINCSGTLSSSVEPIAEYWCCTVSAMDWLPFLPQSISSQVWPTPGGSKPATNRPSATQACTINPSFLVQSYYGTPCQLMSASCRLPALAQLNTIQLMQLPTDHIFNCTTALFLSAAVRLPVGHHYCSYYFYGTHLYLHHGAILLDYRVGTFSARRRRQSTLTSSELNVKWMGVVIRVGGTHWNALHRYFLCAS